MTRSVQSIALVALMAVIGSSLSVEKATAGEALGYKLTTDVVYGQGAITKDGRVVMRDLMMDVYEPVDDGERVDRPAVVLVHGGAFHRGGRRFHPYRQYGGVHSMMEDYARLLTPLGYVCFVLEYRLIPDNPVPELAPDGSGLQSYETVITEAGLERVALVRREMQLSQLTPDDKLVLWNGVLAAAEDVKKAVDHIGHSAETFGIDPSRIAIGGHSAGAASVLNAVYGLKARVAAAFPMSPAAIGFDLNQVMDSPELPPFLLLLSQFDLDSVSETVPYVLSAARSAGVSHEFAWVPGFGHFYPTGAVSLGDDASRMSIGERVTRFLERELE